MAEPAHHTCPLCEASCAISVHLDGDRVGTIRGDPRDPLSRGHLCVKARALKDLHEDPDRLRQPVRRTAAGWEQLSWSDAFDLAAEGLAGVRREHGPEALATYFGEPITHNLGATLFSDELIEALGAKKAFSANSLDQLPKQLVSHWMYGSGLFLSVPDIERTAHMLIIGANPVISNGSLMTAPGMRRRLRDVQRRGGRVVVIDPRRTETAEIAGEHHFIWPGTDGLLLAALIHVIVQEGRVRIGALSSRVQGLETVVEAISDLTPERVEDRTGIAAQAIRSIAREFSDAPSAVCYGRMGTCTVPLGTTTSWLIEVLNIVTGNLDRPGGAMFPDPPIDVMSLRGKTERGRWRSRTRGTPEFMGELPTATLAEEIEEPGDGQVRALVTLAGNPVLSSPAGHRLGAALEKLDFMVSIDFYRNETTRHADIILPPLGPLERDHLDVAFQLFAVRHTARWSPAVFEPAADVRSDAEILLELSRRLRRGRGAGGRAIAAAERALLLLGAARGVRLAAALALRFGPHGKGLRPRRAGLTLGRLRREVHGVDLGPLESGLPARLPTRSKQIDLAPAEIVADARRLRHTLATPPEDLVLIGRRQVRTVNSWSHNLPRLAAGGDGCVLEIHPRDAERKGVEDGARVELASRVGQITVPIRITNRMMPGVLSLPHGYGHVGPDLGLRVAAAHPGASINELTDPAEIDPPSGNAVLNGTPVRITRTADPHAG